MTLRAGRISYTNDLPIYHAFDEDIEFARRTKLAGQPFEL